MTSVLVCKKAQEKMKRRGIKYAFVHVAFRHGSWFTDPYDANIMHVRYHGHEVICRKRYNGLFVITVNTNVKNEHAMLPIKTPPYSVLETADTSMNWRRKNPAVSRVPSDTSEIFTNVKEITEKIIKSHKTHGWVGTEIKSLDIVKNNIV